MSKSVLSVTVLALAAGSAFGAFNAGNLSAQTSMTSVSDLAGNTYRTDGLRSAGIGTTYNAVTALATGTGSIFLLESTTAPTADNVVTFDGIAEPINNYVAAAGGISRTVNEAQVVSDPLLPAGSSVFSIAGSGDLFPSGLAVGAGPLTRPVVGFGVGLPPSLGGLDTVNWNPASFITSATLTLFNAGGPFVSFNITGLANPWTGSFLVTLPATVDFGLGPVALAGAGLNRADFQVNWVPTPGAAGLLAIAGVVATRRRRA